MELDAEQKEDFVSYWRGCPFVYKNEMIVTCDDVRKTSNKHIGYGQKYYVHADYGSIHRAEVTISRLEDLEPYFIPNGFYQMEKRQALWYSRRPERIMKKGMCVENMNVFALPSIKEGVAEVDIVKARFRVDDIAKIYYKKTYTPQKVYDNSDYSYALSTNIAIVSSAYGIPIVLYKLSPVGYMDDNKIFVSKNKECSRELIEEETSLTTEVY